MHWNGVRVVCVEDSLKSRNAIFDAARLCGFKPCPFASGGRICLRPFGAQLVRIDRSLALALSRGEFATRCVAAARLNLLSTQNQILTARKRKKTPTPL